MLQTFQCFNCCGLRVESVRYEEICPNCGGLMALPLWNLDKLLRESGLPVHTEANGREFVSIGSLLSDEPFLLSYAMGEQYVRQASEKGNLVALFVRPGDVAQAELPEYVTPVYSQQPQVDFFLFHNWLIENTEFYGIPVETDVDPISYAQIAPFNVWAGDRVTVYPGAVISNAVVDDNATIGPGAVIGVSGARLIRKPDGAFFHALHGGSVYIGEGAFIGANAVVVRSVWRKPTMIGAGAFVGNLVNVGHNVQIEPGAIVLPGVLLAGRCVIKSTGRVSMGAKITNGVTVAGTVQMGAVVTQDVPEGTIVSGNFATNHNAQIRRVKRLADQGG